MTTEVEERRYHKNPYIGKEEELIVLEADGDKTLFKDELRKHAKKLLEELEVRLFREDFEHDHSVYTGSSGIILTYWYLTNTKKIPLSPAISQRLYNFVDRLSKGKITKGKRITFLAGDAGPLALGLLISLDAKQKLKFRQAIIDLQHLAFKKVGADGNVVPNELLYGRVGYLYTLLFLNKCLETEMEVIEPVTGIFVRELCPKFPSSLIAKLVSFIVEDGVRDRQRNGPPLHYEWHEKIYLGAAHGYVGILYILLKAKEYLSSVHESFVKDTLDWILTQQFPSGNLRSSVGSKEDKLVHWCHGAPGAIFLYLQAAKVYCGEGKYLKAALAAGEVVWHRGILKKSYSICHGTAGNAYSLMALFIFTKDEIWLRRACLLARWNFSWGSKATQSPDRPNSLFEGLAGSVYMLHDFLSVFDSDSSSPKFPAFELD